MQSPPPLCPRPLLLAALTALATLPVTAQRASIPEAGPESPSGEGTCGSNVTPEEAAQILELQEMGMYELDAPPEYLFQVPLTFHIVRRTNGTGGLTEAQLDENIPVLNANYLAAGIQFFRPGPAIVIQSDFYFNQISSSLLIDSLLGIGPVANTINVYFVDAASSGGQGLCGRASFTSSTTQGVLMVNGCTSSAGNPSTFTHELGHYFDLYHTHETAFGLECPSGSNCPIAGDLLCDTPADPELSSANTSMCTYTGSATRCGQSFNPPVSNFMSYGDKPCRTTFTDGQRDRAVATLVNLRSNLIPGQLSSVVWVDLDFSGRFRFGSYAFPENTLADGLAGVAAGGKVVIKRSSTSTPITVNQNVRIDSFRGTSTVGQ